MKSIKDPVHGYVEVDTPAIMLLDSPLLQRLRHIKQLGFSYLVYPGANHTRFEHSLGTMHLAGVMCRQLGVPEYDRLLIVTAALLHDIGHGPFSHSIEPVMEELTGRSHHRIGNLLKSDALAPLLEKIGVDRNELGEVLAGEHQLSGIIHGELDVDRMDYLLRDAHYTGVPYGTVDAQRLIRSTLLSEEGIVIHESGINAAESLLIARTLMRPAVYFHHVSRIAETMFNHAVLRHLENKSPSEVTGMMYMDDVSCIHALRTSDCNVSREFAERIFCRKLYKRALYVGREQVNTQALAEFRGIPAQREIADEIAGIAGVDPSLVLVDIPELPSGMSLHVQVKNRHRVVELAEVSPLLNTLNDNRLEQWRLGVYTPPELTDEVEIIASSVFHVKPMTMQGKLEV
ncbi:MAG: HD domain-containing protein, partial [Methanomicrobiales archaeon]